MNSYGINLEKLKAKIPEIKLNKKILELCNMKRKNAVSIISGELHPGTFDVLHHHPRTYQRPVSRDS